MEFERPLLFIATLLCITAVFLLRLFKIRPSKEGWLRITAFALGIVALSAPSVVTTTKAPKVVFLLDRSASCRNYATTAPQLIRQKIKRLPPDTSVIVAAFDKNFEILFQGRADEFPANLQTGEFLKEGSDIGGALRAVASSIKKGEKVTVYLFGDGNYSANPISVLPIDSLDKLFLYGVSIPNPPDASIFSVNIPPLKPKQSATAYIGIASNYETEASIVVTLPDSEKKEFSVHLNKGLTQIALPFLAPERDSVMGLYLEAPSDTNDINNSATFHLKPTGKVRILYASNDKQRPLRKALEVAYGCEIVWLPPLALPQDSEFLKSFDAVVLDDVSTGTLPSNFASSLIDAVENSGVGLILAGAISSFGAGSYSNSPIERILPVNCTPKERIPLALTLLIDKSATMSKEVVTPEGRRLKFEVAVETALSALGALKKGDSLAVFLFDSRTHKIRGLSKITNEEEIKSLSQDMRRYSPEGSTFLFTALDTAFKEYKDTGKAFRKAILLVSDGKSMEDKKIDYEQFKEKDVAVYCLGVGEDRNSTLLSKIASKTGGAYYEVGFDPQDMRETFFKIVKEIEKYTSEPGEYEVEGMTFVPPVRVHSRTAPKEGADVPFNVGKYPLAARWRVGAGATVALTTSVDKSGAPLWLDWNGLASFARWLLDYARRKTSESDWGISLETDAEGTHLVVFAPESENLFEELYLVLRDREYRLQIRAPSVYEADAEIEGDISTIALIKEKNNIIASVPLNILNSERRIVANDVARLKAIANCCGGELLSTDRYLEHQPAGWELRRTELWWYFVIALIFCLLLSLFIRFLHLRR